MPSHQETDRMEEEEYNNMKELVMLVCLECLECCRLMHAVAHYYFEDDDAHVR